VRFREGITLWRVRDHDGQPYFSRMTVRWQAGSKSYRQTFYWSRGAGTSALPFWHWRRAEAGQVSAASGSLPSGFG
jgi:hypothetical protein